MYRYGLSLLLLFKLSTSLIPLELQTDDLSAKPDYFSLSVLD